LNAKWASMMIRSFKKQDVELVPDAWQRFEKFIREIAKAGPQHRKPIEKSKVKSGAKESPDVLSGAGKSKQGSK
jgi:hypothetical protein